MMRRIQLQAALACIGIGFDDLESASCGVGRNRFRLVLGGVFLVLGRHAHVFGRTHQRLAFTSAVVARSLHRPAGRSPPWRHGWTDTVSALRRESRFRNWTENFSPKQEKLFTRKGVGWKTSRRKSLPPCGVSGGATPSARKEVGRITRANERAVRNWFEGRNGPSGENLMSLIRASDAVFETVLALSGRRSDLSAVHVPALRERLKLLLDLIDEAHPR